MLPERVLPIPIAFGDPKLLKRLGVTFLLEVIDDLPRNIPVHKSMDILRFHQAVGDEMKVVEHYHVGKDQKST